MVEELAIFGGEPTRKDPFAPYPILGEEERREVMEVLDSGVLSGFIANAGEVFFGGPKVRKLESEFCAYFNVEFAVACNSATAGLHMAVEALGIGPGDEVIVPPYTMSATASSVLMANAVPVFADIRDDDFCLDAASVAAAVTPRTKAIIVVHLFGHPAEMDAITAVAKAHNLKIIEDCAQAPGARYNGRLVGTIGDIGIFSFNQHKTVTTGEGGVAVTNNSKLALKMQLVRNHGEAIVRPMGEEDIINTLGWNYRMTELEAAVGIAQFRKLDKLTSPRVELADYLTAELSGLEGITPPAVREGSTHVYFVYPVRFVAAKVGASRDDFVKALVAEGIPFGAGYVRPIYLEPAWQRRLCYGGRGCPFACPWYEGELRYERGVCPVVERLHFDELMTTNICRSGVTLKDAKDVVRAFKKVYNAADKLAGGLKI